MRPRVSTLEVILANVDGVDRNCLEVILQGTPWVVIDAEPLQIENVVRDASVPIVLCDRDHSDCWRRLIRTLMKARRDVCVILLSSETDPSDYDEVVRCGGFDILTRPPEEAGVAHAALRLHLLARPRAIFVATAPRVFASENSRLRIGRLRDSDNSCRVRAGSRSRSIVTRSRLS